MICSAIGRFQKPSLKFLLSTTALSVTFLTGCGGGGGGGGESTGADAFRTAEFNRSTGLQQISAAEGYARITGRQGGDGVRIAVIDNGIDVDHPDLQGAIVSSINVTGAGTTPGNHGTPVAGIIAARKNGQGTHGVAFNSSIVNIQITNGDIKRPVPVFVDRGIRTAAGAPDGLSGGEADIMNLSLGGDSSLDALSAMQDAARRDKIMVISAGNIEDINDNDTIDDEIATGRFLDPQFPAQNAIDPVIDGLAIVVGAVTLDNEEPLFTYRCGVARDVCLFAPGVGIRTTVANGNDAPRTGTSFSAPMVAGAAAVVKAAFPGMSNRAIVQRLLSTAKPIDIDGDGDIDAEDANIVGRGLLDLNNALNPQGTMNVATGATVDGIGAPLDQSALSLGNGLALRGPGAALLDKVVAFDADSFPFGVDLSARAETQSRETGLAAFLGSSRTETSHQVTDVGTFSFQLDEDPLEVDPHRVEFASEIGLEEPDQRVIKVAFHSAVSEDLSVFGLLNQSGTIDAGLQQTISADGGGLLRPGAFLTPFDDLAGSQSGGGFSYALSDKTKLTLAAFTSGEDQGNADASLQKIELSHKTVGDIELRLGYGWLSESQRFLGSESQGAFGGDNSGESQYLNLSLIAPVTEDVSLFGAYSSGWTDIGAGSANSTLIDDWSTVRSDAFGVGLAISDLVEEGDGLTLMVGQPLRAAEGSATVTVPVGRTETGQVLTETGKIDLSPDAREIVGEMAYRFVLDDDASSLSTGTFVRFNPDHDPDADPDIGIGIRYQLKF